MCGQRPRPTTGASPAGAASAHRRSLRREAAAIFMMVGRGTRDIPSPALSVQLITLRGTTHVRRCSWTNQLSANLAPGPTAATVVGQGQTTVAGRGQATMADQDQAMAADHMAARPAITGIPVAASAVRVRRLRIAPAAATAVAVAVDLIGANRHDCYREALVQRLHNLRRRCSHQRSLLMGATPFF